MGRIINEQRNLYKVVTEKGIINAKLKGSYLNSIEDLEEFPRVGDFVALEILDDQAIIHGLITRKNALAKKISGNRFDTQILGANLDCIFIVMGLNNDYNLRRLERYISIANDSNIKYVILLNKMDVCTNYQEKVEECKKIGLTDDVFAISALMNLNMNVLTALIKPSLTYTFIGSSGAGKSTIINFLMNEEVQVTHELTTSNKGSHTTTSREMFLLPNGGIVIDTPGMKTIGLIDEKESIGTSFNDIEELAKQCKFKDCTHNTEPGCKVKEAINLGTLDIFRLKSYNKLLKETLYFERKMMLSEKRKQKRT